jgi:hypothetical protein
MVSFQFAVPLGHRLEAALQQDVPCRRELRGVAREKSRLRTWRKVPVSLSAKDEEDTGGKDCCEGREDGGVVVESLRQVEREEAGARRRRGRVASGGHEAVRGVLGTSARPASRRRRLIARLEDDKLVSDKTSLLRGAPHFEHSGLGSTSSVTSSPFSPGDCLPSKMYGPHFSVIRSCFPLTAGCSTSPSASHREPETCHRVDHVPPHVLSPSRLLRMMCRVVLWALLTQKPRRLSRLAVPAPGGVSVFETTAPTAGLSSPLCSRVPRTAQLGCLQLR